MKRRNTMWNRFALMTIMLLALTIVSAWLWYATYRKGRSAPAPSKLEVPSADRADIGTPSQIPTPPQQEESKKDEVATGDTVTISNNTFLPQTIKVKVGTAVKFTNNDSTDHTITEENGRFDIQFGSGSTASISQSPAGTYNYHCKIHPEMKGTIIWE